jgi:hypothetical protein
MIALFPARLSFAEQNVGTKSQPKSEQISNSGSSAVGHISITLVGKNASDFQETTNCRRTLGVAKNCTVKVTFQPSAKGNRSAELEIKDTALAKTQIIPLTGIGK